MATRITTTEPEAIVDKLLRAHSELDEAEAIRLRVLSDKQRSALIKSACAAAGAILRSRRSSGLPDPIPAPWPDSTWTYLKEWAARGK